jgi:hypothetical protein
MRVNELKSEKCDDIHRLSDHELEVVTGGADSKNLVLCEGFYDTKQVCHELMEPIAKGW